MPSIMEALTKLHSIDVINSEGYGWLDSNRNGTFNTFSEFLKGFFSNDQDGFWQGWYDLFESNFLDYKIFNALYENRRVL